MEEVNNTKKLIENVKATMAIENHVLTNEEVSLITNYANGVVSMEDALKIIKNECLGGM